MRQRGSYARLTEQPCAALALIKYVVFCLQLALARNTVQHQALTSTGERSGGKGGEVETYDLNTTSVPHMVLTT